MSDLKYGPQTEAILALISRARQLTPGELTALGAAWERSVSAQRDAAVNAVLAVRSDASAVRAVVWRVIPDDTGYATRYAVVDAALALVARGLIPDGAYRTLTGPWGEVAGKAHPDDPDRRGDPDA
jgi:hypothetical protein